MNFATRIKQFIRGGQTFLHDLHMFGQLLWKLVRLAPLLITVHADVVVCGSRDPMTNNS
jgi:hypothetical protein